MLPSLLAALVMTQSPTTQPVFRQDDVVDVYHGVEVRDPFRWLEDNASPDTRAFIEAQNEKSSAFLASPIRDEIRARLEELINYPRASAPTRTDRYYIFRRNTGLQQHSLTFVTESLDKPERVLFDPNTFSADGTVALSGLDFTKDGSLVAWGQSVGGSDQQTIRIRNVATGEDLPDVLDNMRFSSIAWLPDNSGFFFNRYPDEDSRSNNRVFFHKLGGDPSKAPVIYERPDAPDLMFGPDVSRDGKLLIIYEVLGTDPRPGILWRELSSTGEFNRLLDIGQFQFSIVETDGTTIWAVTDHQAPRRRLVEVDARNPAPEHWKTIIPEPAGRDVLADVTMINDQFVANFTIDARTRLELFQRDGTRLREIPLPTIGTAFVSGRREDAEMFLTFTSFTYPTTVFRHNLQSGSVEPFFQPQVKFDPDAYETKQLFATSRDGTRIPVFVTHKKDLPLDGTNPTLLYGYGGFGVGMSPFFDPNGIAWLERGGVYAVAVIRGGDEYGTEWHDAGKLLRKQNTFDDFIAAGELLIHQRITSPKHLGIEGGSNGGLLVAAVMLQRPDLFNAVICQVGVLDMLRFHRFGTGRFWTVEYGSAEDSLEMFNNLRRYSPLHNVKPNASYPPILITTGDGDDRVVPAHSLNSPPNSKLDPTPKTSSSSVTTSAPATALANPSPKPSTNRPTSTDSSSKRSAQNRIAYRRKQPSSDARRPRDPTRTNHANKLNPGRTIRHL
jgi:prolyl oligopeptidase